MEILRTSKIHDNRLFIPQNIRTMFNLHDNDIIVWIKDHNGNLILKKSNDFTQTSSGNMTII